ncbi:MAG: TonB family protein [bacterium]
MKYVLSTAILVSTSTIAIAQFDHLRWKDRQSQRKDTTVIVYDEFIDDCYHGILPQSFPAVQIDTIAVGEPENIDKVPYPIAGLKVLAGSVVYPELAQRAGIEGNLMLTAIIDIHGRPRDVIVRKSSGDIFNDAAVISLQNAQFVPAQRKGDSIESVIAVLFSFRLDTDDHITKKNVSIDKIIVHKGPCLMGCASYTITLNRDGVATYEGHSDVERLGKWKSLLPKYRYMEISSLIYAVRFFSMDKSHSNLATDQPWVELAVTAGNETKKVSADACYPPLWGLASLVEYMANELKWERVVK